MIVTVPAALDGVRVDRAVALLADVSRGQAAELVAAGRVAVDGVPVATRSTALGAGSTLAVDLPDAPPAGVEPEPDVELRVVHADAAVVVVDKPAGVVVHPGAGHAHGTLVAGLLARFPDLADLGRAGVGDPERPGIVHRLDRGTSGLLVVARTAAAYQSLTAQLAERTVGRRYVALVTGHVADDRGVVDAPIGRSSRTPTKMAVSANGRPARTGYRVLRRLGAQPAFDQPSTLLALALETGRTHQIRVHLAAIGHPVVGDDRYGPPGRAGGRALPPGRLFLHAAQLGFDHPSRGDRVVWTSPLPDDLAGLTGPVDVDDL
ncbi:MAG TPA: RluA family pseudouridine synthase [Acidimicrobiales bacterium]|jgi:23S rRNA pseudouridine1911/1915/1917 synthase